jgi:hypothetical protein
VTVAQGEIVYAGHLRDGHSRRAFRPAEDADVLRIEGVEQVSWQRPVFGVGVALGCEVLDAVEHASDVSGEVPWCQGGYVERECEPAVGGLAEGVVRVIRRDRHIAVAGELLHPDGGVRTVIGRAAPTGYGPVSAGSVSCTGMERFQGAWRRGGRGFPMRRYRHEDDSHQCGPAVVRVHAGGL